jgi:transposase-like protein
MQTDMGIIKVEINLSELSQALETFKRNRLKAFETLTAEVKDAVSGTLNQLLHAEMSLFLGKAEESGNKRNGYKEREYALKGIGCIRLRMPIDRKRRFDSEIIPAREQIDPRLKEDIAVLHLAGISTRMVAMISRRLLGVSVSTDTVRKSLHVIEAQAVSWFDRPLDDPYWALFIDGTNFRLQRRGSTEKEPSLVVLGINTRNQLSILAIEPGQKDNAACWETVFADLKQRGLKADQVRIGIMDGLSGLETAFKTAFTNAVTARCWVHALRNAMAKSPARLAAPFKVLAHKVMYAASLNDARVAFAALKEAMGSDAERAVQCLEKDLDSLLAHYRFDKTLWRPLKTTNPIERVNKELKRRTKVMESVGERTLRIVTAFVALRLEYYWQKIPLDASQLNHLLPLKTNDTDLALNSVFH